MKIFYVFLIFCCTINLQCKNQSNVLSTELASILEKEKVENHFSGSVVVGFQDRIFFQENYGYANRESKRKLTDITCFDIASLNKSFVAALVLLAVEEEKLRLNTNLIDLLKDYEYSGRFHPDITIHQLLTHTSGLGDYQHIDKALSANNFKPFKAMHFDNASYVDFISKIPTVAAPNSTYYYSNFGYHLLCIVLEDLYQKPFADLLEEKICNPFGLQQTFAPKTRAGLDQVAAQGYRLIDGAWEANPYIDLSIGRRIYASAEDLYRWGRLLQKETLLESSSIDLMFTNHLEALSATYSYGYGWAIHRDGDNLAPGNLGIQQSYYIHGGQTDGFKSLLILMENGYQLSILCNSGNQTDIIALSRKLVEKIIAHEK